ALDATASSTPMPQGFEFVTVHPSHWPLFGRCPIGRVKGQRNRKAPFLFLRRCSRSARIGNPLLQSGSRYARTWNGQEIVGLYSHRHNRAFFPDPCLVRTRTMLSDGSVTGWLG